jgi:hypothetical protein
MVRMAILHHEFRLVWEPAIRDIRFGAEMGNVAAAIASGWGFSSPSKLVRTGPTAWFVPIYPYLFAAVLKIFGIFSYQSHVIMHSINAAFAAFTCWPIRNIGDRAFGKKTGLAAAWLWVVLPTSLFFPMVWDTALAGLWMAILVAATLGLRGSDRVRSWVVYGALWAVGAMINPSLLSVLPFLALWAIWPLRKQFTRASQLAAAASIIFLVGIAPWTARNYVVFHKIIPFRSNFGLELWLGNHPGVTDTPTEALHPNDVTSEALKYARMTEIPYMQEKQRESFDFIRTHPRDVARMTFRRFVENWLGFWDTPADWWGHASLALKASFVSNSAFALFSLLGILFAYRSKRDATTAMALVLLVFPLVFYLTRTSLRYRYPMDPVMEVLATYAIAYPLTQWAQWRASRLSRSATDLQGSPARN